MKTKLSKWHIIQLVRGGDSSDYSRSFFPIPWAKNTIINCIGLKISTISPIKIKVYLQKKDKKIILLKEILCIYHEEIIPLLHPKDCGERVYFEIEQQKNLNNFKASWVCDTNPVYKPHLAIIVCTYNRETELNKLLNQIYNEIYKNNYIELYIVNQGDKLKIKKTNNVFTFHQKNMGGSGGFTRGIIESLKNPNITNIILMDDDVEIQENLIRNIYYILQYIPPNLCLGGMMVDIKNKDQIISLGNKVDLKKLSTNDLIPREGLSLKKNRTLEYIAQGIAVDFCGWWCFCMSRMAVEKCGLPLPLFIRGDDAEYGVRLNKSGFSTIMWPSISVAHPNLRFKTKAWHHFYDRRNALIRASFHGNSPTYFSLMGLIRGIVNALVTYRYDYAEAGILAIENYIKGPDSLTEWTEKKHNDLLKKSSTTTCFSKSPPIVLPIYSNSTFRTIITASRLIKDIFIKPRNKENITIKDKFWKIGTKKRPEAITLISEEYITKLKYDKTTLRGLTKRLLKTLIYFIFCRHKFYEDFSRMTTSEWWSKQFEKNNL